MSVQTPARIADHASRESVAYVMFIEGYRARMADVDATVDFSDRDAFDDSLFARFQRSYHETVANGPVPTSAGPASTSTARTARPHRKGEFDPSTRSAESR